MLQRILGSRSAMSSDSARQKPGREVVLLRGSHRVKELHCDHGSWNRPRHLVFDDGWIIRIRLSSPRSSERKPLVETNRGLVVARDHQLQDAGVATSGPVEDFVYQ